MKNNGNLVNDFFYQAVDLMCIADLDGYFRKVNQSFQVTLGYSEEELLSRSFLSFIHPDDKESTRLKLKDLEKGNAAINFLNRYRTSEGDYRWLSWHAKYDLSVKLIYATARDVSKQKKTEEKLRRAKKKLEQANQDLEAFSYSVSHDLRTPLRAIEGFSQILLEDFTDQLDSEGQRLLDVITANTQKMGNLIEDILTFSRVSRADLIKTMVDMKKLFTEAYSEVLEAYPDSDIKKKIELNIQELPPARGDASLLRQVAVNLLSNAVKYSSRKDKIYIEVGYTEEDQTRTGGEYYIQDNGVGFDMKYADKLFHVFQRLHSSSEYEGTGVGLSLVKRIIDHHGGSIRAESKPGEGSAFYFSFSDSLTQKNSF